VVVNMMSSKKMEEASTMWKLHEKRLVVLSFVVAFIMFLSLIGRIFS
jgi:hypothetical protein